MIIYVELYGLTFSIGLLLILLCHSNSIKNEAIETLERLNNFYNTIHDKEK